MDNECWLPIKKESRAGRYRESIVRVSRDDLSPGRLAELFQSGAKAVILTGDQRVLQLWEGLFGATSGDSARVGDDRLHWEASILNTAQNHRSGEMNSGDMLRFVPGSYAHIARKTIVFQEPGRQKLQAIPEHFWNGNARMPMPQNLLRTAWDLMVQILRSALLDSPEHPPYAVAIEQLKYPSSSADLDKIFDLLADSGGGWTRIGQRLDFYKAMATGPFDIKVIRDLFAGLSLMPGARPLLHRANKFLMNFSGKDVSEDVRIIGAPHVDGTKALTALASARDVLITEIYDGKCWLELPLSPDVLAIFPSEKISTLGVEPTVHRILMKERHNGSALYRFNLTLSLAVVDRPHFMPEAPEALNSITDPSKQQRIAAQSAS